MQRGEIDLVIVGSDRTLGRTGEVANKIGTYTDEASLPAWERPAPLRESERGMQVSAPACNGWRTWARKISRVWPQVVQSLIACWAVVWCQAR